MSTQQVNQQVNEHNERRDIHEVNLRPMRRLGHLAGAVTVAALVVAACGSQPETDGPSIGAVTVEPSASLTDNGPVWLPDQSALDEALNDRDSSPTVAPPEYGAMPAPTWNPDYRRLDEALKDRDSSPTVAPPEYGGMPAPAWNPNYGRLETYLGAEPVTAPR